MCRAEISRGEQRNQGKGVCEREKRSKHVTYFHLGRKRKRRIRSMRATVWPEPPKRKGGVENHKNQAYPTIRKVDAGFKKNHLPIFTSPGSLPIFRKV